MAFILTRIQVGNYDAWKPMFDQDAPGARQAAKGHRILRSVDDPNEVFIMVEFASADEANAGREKLLASGVLDRFSDKTLPKVVEEAEAVSY
jgi:heme-degrading monooxygenase HmoA